MAVVAALEAEGDTLETSNLDRLIPRGVEWGYCEMPHRTGFPVTTAESWDILPESAGLLEEVLRRVEATLTWQGRAQVRVEELLEGGSRTRYWLHTGSRRLLRGLWSHEEYAEYQRWLAMNNNVSMELPGF